MKGVEQLRKKLPAFHGPRALLLPLTAIAVMLTGLLFLVAIDILPRRVPGGMLLVSLEPVLPIIGGIILGAVAIFLISGLWRNKNRAIQVHGALAYQKLIVRGLSGVVLVVSIVLHSFLSVRSLVSVPPVNQTTILFSQSFLALLDIPTIIDVVLRVGMSIPVVLIATLLVRRAIYTFGIDYMMVVYLFFPEESEVIENEIYSVIRHPAYFSGLLLALGGFLLRLSFYSLVYLGLVYIIFWTHLRYEEGELMDRFGESYRNYMKKVPGLHVRMKDIGTLLRFIKGTDSQKK